MSVIELVNKLSEEAQKLVDAQRDYDSARSALLNWMERDIERSEGSGRQEALREKHYDSLREHERSAEDAFYQQKAIVVKLAEQIKNL
ncbi:hypothetical protein ABRP70_12535 [Pectobacterium odoriferum]|uniref:hypothetical protein n=1 Tax=Pectobacterium odoriferum TaxID=78398 RepID=UPI000501696B|nr:hypothetical protein [Pectobacterium odoriferum]KGA36977.1 hypothetical protein KS43_09130 [Pectobacterium odoriferum]MBA0189452.1 hypothetical protein [Pectobacterium odoriferum]POD89726.1 hypothetical protein BV925_20790 [Pectobacterium odoriferum]POE05090.1 hypothetical protein BV916_06200 [Pectobacterium odoriferum]